MYLNIHTWISISTWIPIFAYGFQSSHVDLHILICICYYCCLALLHDEGGPQPPPYSGAWAQLQWNLLWCTGGRTYSKYRWQYVTWIRTNVHPLSKSNLSVHAGPIFSEVSMENTCANKGDLLEQAQQSVECVCRIKPHPNHAKYG